MLKNAIDWASRPFPENALHGRPVAVVGASTGLFGAVWAQAELRKVLHHAGAHVLEEELPVGLADDAFTPSGELADPELRQRLVWLLEALRGRSPPRSPWPARAGRPRKRRTSRTNWRRCWNRKPWPASW